MDGHGNEVAAAAAPAIEEWALPTDEDEVKELAAMGVRFDGGLLTLEGDHAATKEDLARLSGAASFYLRRIASSRAEQEAIEARRRMEELRLEVVYGPQVTAEVQRQEHFTKRLEQIIDAVQALGGFERKKSIATGGGTFGVKACPAKAKIVDAVAVTEWAKMTVPECVRVTLQTTWESYVAIRGALAGAQIETQEDGSPVLTEKAVDVLITALRDAGIDPINAAEQIPGIAVEPARVDYVIKPLPEGA